MTKKTKAAEALKFVESKVPESATWVDLHNAFYGVGALFSQLFPTEQERIEFGKTKESKRIGELISQLRKSAGDPPAIEDKQKDGMVMSLRMPTSLHAAITREAAAEGVSVNQLCVIKLAMSLADRLR